MSAKGIAARHMIETFKVLTGKLTSPYVESCPSGGVVICTGEADPFGNAAIGLDKDEVKAAAEKLSSQDVPSMFLTANDRCEASEAVLQSFGYEYSGAIPGMVADLGADLDCGVPEGCAVTRVPSHDDGEDFAAFLSMAYPIAPLAARLFSPAEVGITDAPDDPVQFFLVTSDGTTVASSALVLAGGVAGVYCVATHPEHRRKGLGAAVTAHTMGVARSLGFTSIVLQASEQGYSTYKRLGFVDESPVHLMMRLPQH